MLIQHILARDPQLLPFLMSDAFQFNGENRKYKTQ